MKIAVLGCCPQSIFLTKAVAQNAQSLDIEKLVIYDEDPRRRSVYGGFCAKLCKLLHPRLRFFCTDNLVEAVIASDFVIVLDIPGFNAQADVYFKKIELQNVFADLCFGPGALNAANYAFPFLEKYCTYVKKYSRPNVRFINFIPPCGIIMQALRAKGYDFIYGIGLSARQLLQDIAKILKTDVSSLDARVSGLSSLSVFDRVILDGHDVLPQLLQNDTFFLQTDAKYLSSDILKTKGFIADRFFSFFLDYKETLSKKADCNQSTVQRQIVRDDALLSALESAEASVSFEAALHIFQSTIQSFQTSGILSETDDISYLTFSPFDRDNALFATETLRFIEALNSSKKEKLFLLAPNAGILPGLSADDIIMHACEVSSAGIFAKGEQIKDTGILEILRRVKFCERGFVKGIVETSEKAKIDSLALFPGIDSYSIAQILLKTDEERKRKRI